MIDCLSNSHINKKVLVILHDLFMVALAWQLAWWVRFNFDFPYFNWYLSILLIPILIGVQGSLFWYFHLYRALWRFASLLDLWNIFRAALIGGVAAALVLFILFRLEGVPRSVLMLYPVFLIFLLGGPRLAYRLWKDHDLSLLPAAAKNKVLIIGAGYAGDLLVRDMHRSDSDAPVAILDDDITLIGAEIRGVKIYGDIEQAQEIINQLGVDWIAIAIPSASRAQIQSIVEICERTNLPIRTLPNIQELKSSLDYVSGLREVSIEDLLGREPVVLNWENIQEFVKDKCVLVTGGGGSIGSILSHQIVGLAPSIMIIIDNSEYNLYKIEQVLTNKLSNTQIIYILGDICDVPQMTFIFEKYRPQLVFHAAAYKHVPILQGQPREAIKNNIQGTKVILDTACLFNVDKFVLISTDKAVNPSNILGASKRIAEMYTESVNHIHATQCITVRFGNVLDSAGSVVPLFREQIKQGGPVTVTHPEITRFFMTISEATQLILQAASMGGGGEIFVLDMGDPVKIQYLAEQMILLSGKRVDDDISIKYSGLRHGEKLYEELFYLNEKQGSTPHDKIFLAKHSPILAKRCIDRIDTFVKDKINSRDEDLNVIMFDFLESLERISHNSDDVGKVIQMKS